MDVDDEIRQHTAVNRASWDAIALRRSCSTQATEFRSFLWPVGDVVTAVIRAGLSVRTVVEQPVPQMWAGLDDIAAARLPAVYAIMASRP